MSEEVSWLIIGTFQSKAQIVETFQSQGDPYQTEKTTRTFATYSPCPYY
jgi:hypothetical protein